MRNHPPTASDAPDTKTRILDTAEVLFAEQGFTATSLRDITAAAGVNLAAVNYHFGSKEALLGAVFERRVVPVNAERLRLLALVEAEADGVPAVDAIVRAFLVPAFQTASESGLREPKFMQLVGRMHSETNSRFREVFLGLFVDVRDRFTAALRRALPDVPDDEIVWRFHFMIGSLAHTLVWDQCGDEAMAPPRQAHTELLDALAQFATAGITGSASARRSPSRRRRATVSAPEQRKASATTRRRARGRQ